MLAKALAALRLDADQEIGEIDRHQDREREQKTDQELLGACRYIPAASPSIDVFDHRCAADVGREPKAVEAGGDQFEQRAAPTSRKKSPRLAGENDARRTSARKRWKRRGVHRDGSL